MDEDTRQLLFDDIVPLPFRILFVVQIGVWLWYILNRAMTSSWHINVAALLNLLYTANSYGQPDRLSLAGEFALAVIPAFNENVQLQRGIANNLVAITIFNVLTWIAFKVGEIMVPGRHLGVIPALAFAYTMYRLFFSPNLSLPAHKHHFGQARAYTTIKRVLRGGINSVTMRSNDILISDSLISYAKVLNDVGLYVWGYYIPTDARYPAGLELAIIAYPTFVRIRQCWFEYRLTGRPLHLANLVKYALGLVPLALNYAIKTTLTTNPDNTKWAWHLTKWWYAASAINSTYSLFWDFRMDWGLDMFDRVWYGRGSWLRPTTTYPPWMYAIGCVIDTLLRFVWVLRVFAIDNAPTTLSQMLRFLFGYDAYLAGYFVIELLEVGRRWMWCFFKLENDWVKLSTEDSLEMGDIKAS